MDDFVKKFTDVYERACELPDFDTSDAMWRIDLSMWQLIIRSRFGAIHLALGSPGDDKLLNMPVMLVATRDLECVRDAVATVPTAIVQPDPCLICLGYKGRFGFYRYVVSAVADAKFRPFDTTGYFTSVSGGL